MLEVGHGHLGLELGLEFMFTAYCSSSNYETAMIGAQALDPFIGVECVDMSLSYDGLNTLMASTRSYTTYDNINKVDVVNVDY